jgi:hypothetical protein
MNYEALLHCYKASLCSMIVSFFQRPQPFWEILCKVLENNQDFFACV